MKSGVLKKLIDLELMAIKNYYNQLNFIDEEYYYRKKEIYEQIIKRRYQTLQDLINLAKKTNQKIEGCLFKGNLCERTSLLFENSL